MKFIKFFPISIIFFTFLSASAQNTTQTFSREDSLRGSITPAREWWDLKFYHLKVRVNPEEKNIEGSTKINYKVLKSYQSMQIDLQPPLVISQILQDGKPLHFRKDGANAHIIDLQKSQKIGNDEIIEVFFSGKPREAKRAPWDGGFSWKKDKNGNHFVATSCQGLGSSIWWACKDHMYDEPDSMLISITTPKDLTDISNGRLRKITENHDNTHTFDWFVANPINNYGVNVNIGKYEHFSEIYEGEKGKLSMDYYVLPENLEKAKLQFKQAPLMMKAFEHWFGAYPFYEDGYKLVEVPYLGMEHQSSVTYGNGYENGYRGRDLSNTGWGLKWDFILVHESGHEWFANNITYKDVADMWIHESFTNYSENLFTEFYHGKQAGAEYVIGCRKLIHNKFPIINKYGVNAEGLDTDMYYKGGNMLHTIRQILNDDEKWREILRGLNKTFYHQTVETKQIEDFMTKNSGKDLSKVFEQYLRNTKIPVFEYKIEGKKLLYRWSDCIEGFNMPLKISLNQGKMKFISPNTDWKSMKLREFKSLEIDKNFYVEVKKD